MPSLFSASERRAAPPAHPHAGRIGPNAILQTVAVLRDQLDDAAVDALLRAHTPYALDRLPSAMVPEADPRALVRGLRDTLGDAWCARVLREAGHRTGDYLLAHRIPRPAQWIMRLLPPTLAFATLSASMARHAWTFAGSGKFTWTAGSRERAPRFEIAGCPMCRGMHASVPMCDFYAGTFEQLLRVLVAGDAVIHEVACEATGDAVCAFVVDGLGPTREASPVPVHPDFG
jgi:divinyl protochlorophyllide a 8-vinyl-reductase